MRKLQIVLAASSLFAIASAANADLIINGDFETGNISPWTTDPGPENDAINIVDVSQGYYGAPVTAANGENVLAFNTGNSSPGGTLSQNITTILGTTYQATFQYATNSGTQSLVASVVGTDGMTVLGTDPVTGDSTSFADESFTFVGDGGTDTIEFYDVPSNNSDGQDGLLDNVSVNSVPEPASIGLLALAGLGLLARRRRIAD